MTASVQPRIHPQRDELAGRRPLDGDDLSPGTFEGYSVRGQVTREEWILAGILGLALILLLIIMGMSVSQYVVLHSSML